MPRTPEEVKRRIMASEEYHDWVTHRRAMGNVPSDIFRAYMIDKGLYAHLQPHEVWGQEPNRRDIVPIDYPMGSVRPEGRRRVPTHREEGKRREPEKPKPIPLTRELKWRAREVAHRYKVPVPAIEMLERTYRHSQQQVSIEAGTRKPKSSGLIRIGVKGAERPQTKTAMLGAFYHELGHHVDAFLGFKKTGVMNKQFVRDALAGQFGGTLGRRSKIGMERRAWRYAIPYMKGKGGGLKGWTKAYALGTYTGAVKRITEL